MEGEKRAQLEHALVSTKRDLELAISDKGRRCTPLGTCKDISACHLGIELLHPKNITVHQPFIFCSSDVLLIPCTAAMKTQSECTIAGLQDTIRIYETQAAKLSTDLDGKIKEVLRVGVLCW